MSDTPIQVLLIDDDEDEFVLIRDILESGNADGAFSLDWEPDYDRALETMRQCRHDVYLVDYRLGHQTGLDLIGRLRAEGLNRAVIMLTGMGGDEVDRAALKAGVFDYLIKGEFSDRELRRSIRYAFERSRTEQELRSQAEVLANVHDGVYLFDQSGTIQTWNRGAEAVFGYPASEMLGTNVSRLITPADRERFLEYTQVSRLKDSPADFTCDCLHRSGEVITVTVRATLLHNEAGEPGGVIVCTHDITAQKRLEQQLLEISENEQRRIGRDLHDDLCQQLAGIGCLTRVLQQRVSEVDPGSGEELSQIGQMVLKANARAREIARGLVPAKLASDGLLSALLELAEQTTRAFATKCTFRASRRLALEDLQTASQLYRIAQEAVSNAVRHGQPSEIKISLDAKGGQLMLTIEDDGTGMTANPDERPNGLGISTMAHRARFLGGDLAILSTPGKGTLVRCTVPYATRSA